MTSDRERFREAEAALWTSVGVASPTEHWVQLRGGEHVRVQVVGEGPPVLFIHGGSSSGVNWAPLVGRLGHFTCLVIDRPGCGLSDPVAGGDRVADITAVQAFADGLIADVLDGLDIERVHVVATSFGGYFALRGAAAHPTRVERLVEMTWAMGAPISHAPLSMRVAAVPGLGAVTTKIPATRFAVKMIMKQIGLARALDAGRVSDEMIDWFVALLRDTDTMSNELRANPKIITPLRGINPKMILPGALISRISAPTLFVWGGEDPMGGEAVARRFATGFRDATVEILPLAGHAPWIDEPELCTQLVSDFLGLAPR